MSSDLCMMGVVEFQFPWGWLLAVPLGGAVVYNSNPAAVAPEQEAVRRGLAREDLFVVVHEQMQTDTADFADILLPAAGVGTSLWLASSLGWKAAVFGAILLASGALAYFFFKLLKKAPGNT